MAMPTAFIRNWAPILPALPFGSALADIEYRLQQISVIKLLRIVRLGHIRGSCHDSEHVQIKDLIKVGAKHVGNSAGVQRLIQQITQTAHSVVNGEALK